KAEHGEQRHGPESLLGKIVRERRVAEVGEKARLALRNRVSLRRELVAEVLRVADVEREPEDERAGSARGDEGGDLDHRREESVEGADSDRGEKREQNREVEG